MMASALPMTRFVTPIRTVLMEKMKMQQDVVRLRLMPWAPELEPPVALVNSEKSFHSALVAASAGLLPRLSRIKERVDF